MRVRKLSGIKKLWWNSALFFDIALSCVVFWATRRLFLNQIYNQDQYVSDLAAHISAALAGDSYSVNSVFLRFFFRVGDYPAIAAYLSAVVVLTMWASAWMVRTLLQINAPKADVGLTKAFAISAPLVFLSSIYLPGRYDVFYYVAENHVTDFTQPWHNSTYLLMRLFSLVAMTLYFRIQSRYLKKYMWVEWGLFLLSLLATNAAKPNFYLAFAPAALCFFVYDLIKNKNLKPIIWFGIPFLLSLPVLLLQKSALYSGGEEEPSGIELSVRLLKQVIQDGIFVPYLVAGASFVALVTVLCIIHRAGKRSLWFGWTAFLISFGTRWLLLETGPRANHGNFAWGVKGTAFLLTAICLERLIGLRIKKKVSMNAYLAACALLVLMIGSGVVYFVKIYLGMSYLI